MKKLLMALLVLISGSVSAEYIAYGSMKPKAVAEAEKVEEPKGWVAQEEQSEEALELDNPEFE